MLSRSAITKLQAVLIIDLVIVGLAAGGYFYVESNKLVTLNQNQVELSELAIDQSQVQAGEALKISAKATNIAEQNGVFLVSLKIDNAPRQNESVTLLRAQTKIVEFIVTEDAEGNHTVKIGGLTATFIVIPRFQLSDLAVNRTIAGVNEPIKISAKVTNTKNESGEYSAVITINGTTRETKSIQLAAGAGATVEFEVAEATEGTYVFSLGSLSGTFKVTAQAPPLESNQVQLADFTLDPEAATVGENVKISVNVTNLAQVAGSYTLNLTINGVLNQTQTIQLSAGANRTLEFTVSENAEGTYSVKLNGLSASFTVQTVLPPPSTVRFSNLFTNPYEAWPNQMVNASVDVTNTGSEEVSFSLAFKLNGTLMDTKRVQLQAGQSTTVVGVVKAAGEGAYRVAVGNVSATFTVAPEGKHTLIVKTFPDGIDFTIDGVQRITPYIDILEVGVYTITFPASVTLTEGGRTGVFNFVSWPDGSKQLTKQINLQKYTFVTPEYFRLSSCPSLFVWNGTAYAYRAEVSAGTGYLGILDYFREDYSLAFLYSDPWDYIKLDRNQIATKNGYFDITLTQMWDELFYIDTVKLAVVDHSADVDVFSTQSTYLYNLTENGKIYTVSKRLATPISAYNSEGQNILPQISKLDGVHTPSYGDFHNETYEINLGSLYNAKQINLVVAGKILYSPGEIQGQWAAQFATQPGVKPFPPPWMEVKAANGSWVRVPDNRQFPLLDVNDDTFVVNLTGLFPTWDYTVRIHTFFDTRFDFIGVDTTPQQNMMVRELKAVSADLTQAFGTNSTSSGNFTRYGDVRQLVLGSDDMFVVGRQGDKVHVQFSADLPPVAAGMERDYFVFVKCWFKVDGLPYLTFTVNPLPFTDMSAFPYPATETYPTDAQHLNYLKQYNTRTIKVQ